MIDGQVPKSHGHWAKKTSKSEKIRTLIIILKLSLEYASPIHASNHLVKVNTTYKDKKIINENIGLQIKFLKPPTF